MFVWSMAVRNLRRRRLRTSLTVSGIVVGVGLMLILISLISGAETRARSMARMMGGADITISNGTRIEGWREGGFFGFGAMRTLNESLMQTIEGVPGVYAVSPQLSFSGYVGVTGNRMIMVYGVEPSSYISVTGGLNIVDGNFLSESSKGEIVLGKTLIEILNLTLGETITLSESQSETRNLKIVGVFETGIPFQENTGYITLADAQEITGQHGLVTQILVKCEDPSMVSDVRDYIQTLMPNVRVTTSMTAVQQASQMLNTLTMFFAAIGLVALTAGSFGVVNTMIMSVTERTREIGILKAIGAKNSDIMKIFMAEAVLIGLLGGFFGVTVGCALAYIFPMLASFLPASSAPLLGVSNPGFGRATPLSGLTPTITPVNATLCFSLGALVGVLAGLYPAWRASRMKPVEALRHV